MIKGNRNIYEEEGIDFWHSPLLVNAKVVYEDNGIASSLKKKELSGIISKSAPAQIREYVLSDVSRIGQTVESFSYKWLD